mgnify:CR=1 FL=1
MCGISLGVDNMLFRNNNHRIWYNQWQADAKRYDVYHRALFYLLALNREMREHIDQLYDFKTHSIKPEAIRAGWQTSGSMAITRLAYNLFNDGMPTIWLYEGNSERQLQESIYYTVADIFACGEYAKYFWQAIQIRYPYLENC